MMRIALIGHNLPHEDPLIREASFSDLFFNHEHPNFDKARRLDRKEDGSLVDTEGALDEFAELRKDAEEFIETLKSATGYSLDPDELVADYLARE